MGYYDSEPQGTEIESTTEPAAEGFEPLVSQATEASEGEDSDEMVPLKRNCYY